MRARIEELGREAQSNQVQNRAAISDLSPASVTAPLDRLERQGHLRRVRDQQDRRRVTLQVEHQALALGAEFFGPLNTELLQAMDAFSDADLEVVGRFLEAMTDVVVANRRARQATNSQP